MANKSTCIFCDLRDRSLFITEGDGGGGLDNFRGFFLIFGRTKGGITENLGRIHRRTTQICLENEDMGGGGIAKNINSY